MQPAELETPTPALITAILNITTLPAGYPFHGASPVSQSKSSERVHYKAASVRAGANGCCRQMVFGAVVAVGGFAVGCTVARAKRFDVRPVAKCDKLRTF